MRGIRLITPVFESLFAHLTGVFGTPELLREVSVLAVASAVHGHLLPPVSIYTRSQDVQIASNECILM